MPNFISAQPKRILRVLYAEDQPIYAGLVALHFEEAGHKVKCVPNGQAAWEAISGDLSKFDLLITDQQMPQLDGLALVRRLRQVGFPGKIVVHAGGLNAEAKSRFEHLKADAIIAKGLESAYLLGTVEMLFQSECNSDPIKANTGHESGHAD